MDETNVFTNYVKEVVKNRDKPKAINELVDTMQDIFNRYDGQIVSIMFGLDMNHRWDNMYGVIDAKRKIYFKKEKNTRLDLMTSEYLYELVFPMVFVGREVYWAGQDQGFHIVKGEEKYDAATNKYYFEKKLGIHWGSNLKLDFPDPFHVLSRNSDYSKYKLEIMKGQEKVELGIERISCKYSREFRNYFQFLEDTKKEISDRLKNNLINLYVLSKQYENCPWKGEEIIKKLKLNPDLLHRIKADVLKADFSERGTEIRSSGPIGQGHHFNGRYFDQDGLPADD